MNATQLQSAPERVLRIKSVCQITGRSRSMVYADMSAGTFPQPVKLGPRAVGWLQSEILGWLAGRVAESRAGLS